MVLRHVSASAPPTRACTPPIVVTIIGSTCHSSPNITSAPPHKLGGTAGRSLLAATILGIPPHRALPRQIRASDHHRRHHDAHITSQPRMAPDLHLPRLCSRR